MTSPHLDTVPLVQSGTALDSMRNSDFDVYSAYGEVIDNSLQADATAIKVAIGFLPKTAGAKQEAITQVAFGDDGHGMDLTVLHNCLQLGYSSRYNDRSGIGRFGVGATLAAINQCKRVDVYSRSSGKKWFHTFFDLDLIGKQEMTGIPKPIADDLPTAHSHLVGPESGTLVVWSKYDRQPDDASAIIQQLEIWMGRTYRHFLEKGVRLELNGKDVKAIDPLYVDVGMTGFPGDPAAFEFKTMTLDWPVPPEDRQPGRPATSRVTIRMSLLPEDFRRTQGSGNSKQAIERHIPDNEGISIVRNGREVFYDHVPHWPGKSFAEIDRWWGCEVSFDALLDKEFTVKNIKRGAVPVRDLKKTLAEKINPTRETALEKVRELWSRTRATELITPTHSGTATGHEEAERAAKNTPTPRGPLDAGKQIDAEAKKIADDWLAHEDDRQKAAWTAKFKSQPFTIMDGDWRGPEFVETSHLGGADVLRYNVRHPFFVELNAIRQALDEQSNDNSAARKLRALIDLLLISHAKAETMIDPKVEWPPEQLLETLRMQWGQYLSNYLATYKKESENA